MASLPKFHLDENMARLVAAELRNFGYDVTTPKDAGLLHATDEQHLTYAAATGRIILTFDVGDYPDLNAAYLMSGREHWGIIISSDILGYEVVKRLKRLLATLTAEDMRNQIRWLNEFK